MCELIKETQKEIAKTLNAFKAEEIKPVFGLFTQFISGNEDFRLAAVEDEKEGLEIVEQQIGRKPELSLFDELDEEKIQLLAEVMDIELNDKKTTKKRAVEIMSEALSDDVLFEGMCLVAFVDDEELKKICEVWGCSNRYELLTQDEVYKARRAYMLNLCAYTKAAANLYGVLHINELQKILEKFETLPDKGDKYRRTEGSYRTTVFYSPEYYCVYSLHNVIGDDIPNIEVTLSGYVLNQVFKGSMEAEIAELNAFVQSKGIQGELSEDDLKDYYNSASKLPYKKLHEVASKKDRYLPSKEVFLQYADDDYRDETPAFRALEGYLRKTYDKDLHDFAVDIQNELYKTGDDFDGNRFTEVTDYAVKELENKYGIAMSSLDKLNELIGYLQDMANSTRLWINNGHTTAELNREAVNAHAKKIYPNDPCPCGSGKKYKKCCGRNI